MTRARTWKILVIALTLTGLGVTLAEAQTFGRVKFIVKLPTGETVPGVKIAVTSAEITNYNKELKTNKKGEAILSVVDATKRYRFRIEHEGFPPAEGEVKPALRQTTTREVLLTPNATASPTTGGGAPEGRLTPAQEAFNTGVTLSQANDLAAAKAKFEEALKYDAKLWNANLALASIYVEEGDYENAVAQANRLLELSPDSARGYRILHEAHTKLGNKGEAKKALQALSNMDGGDAAAVVYNEGVAAFRVGDDKTAKENFLQALEVKPDLLPAIQALALIHLRGGEFTEAAAMAERALGFEPENPKMLRLRWEAYRSAGDTAKEKEAFDVLAAADPQVLIKDLFDTAAKQFEAGDIANARGNFERVLDIDPDHPRAHFQLALCLVNSGENTAAREHFQKFIELAPEDPETATAKEMLGFLQ